MSAVAIIAIRFVGSSMAGKTPCSFATGTTPPTFSAKYAGRSHVNAVFGASCGNACSARCSPLIGPVPQSCCAPTEERNTT
jgi:hypothetical protein